MGSWFKNNKLRFVIPQTIANDLRPFFNRHRIIFRGLKEVCFYNNVILLNDYCRNMKMIQIRNHIIGLQIRSICQFNPLNLIKTIKLLSKDFRKLRISQLAIINIQASGNVLTVKTFYSCVFVILDAAWCDPIRFIPYRVDYLAPYYLAP